MGSVTINTAIENKFATSWGATTVIAYDNVNFTPPENASWVKIYVRDGDSTKVSIGSSQQIRRTFGTVFVDIFTVIGQGSLTVRTLADSVKTIFRDLFLSGIQFYEGDVMVFGEKYYTNSGTGVPATSQWYQATVSIPFRYDEVL